MMPRLLTSLVLPVALFCLSTPAVFAGGQTTTDGPDVTIYSLADISNEGADGDYRGFSVGTDSCNIGNQPLNWCDESGGCGSLTAKQHPVIAGNLFRVKDGRLEQLGKSWLKHGFFSTNSFNPACGDSGNPDNPPDCSNPPLGPDQLGVGCTDLYGSYLNGSRALGMRYEVNPANGNFAFPETEMPFSGNVEQRIRVHRDDLDPAMNSGARYFFESQYVADNDALAVTNGVSNAFNNASYREASVSSGSLNMNFVTSTVRERSAIHAWKAVDDSVEIANADFVGSAGVQERFEVARKITQDGGTYTTVIAIRNMNSEHAARSFSVSFDGAAGIGSPTFHDVDNHSGETASGEGDAVLKSDDWATNMTTDSLSWSTDDFATDPAGNALRWGTAFTFSFESTSDPANADYEIGLYKAGPVPSVMVPFAEGAFFSDGFEDGGLTKWTNTGP